MRRKRALREIDLPEEMTARQLFKEMTAQELLSIAHCAHSLNGTIILQLGPPCRVSLAIDTDTLVNMIPGLLQWMPKKLKKNMMDNIVWTGGFLGNDAR